MAWRERNACASGHIGKKGEARGQKGIYFYSSAAD